MTDDVSSKLFDAGKAHTKVETFAASSKEVNTGALRLEAAFYGSAGYRAMKTMMRAGFQMTNVGQLAHVVWLGLFGRTYVDDPAAGVPFLSSSEMLDAKPAPKNFISKALTRNLDAVLVHPGMILISRSGTVGNITICPTDMEGIAVSEHAIRVIPGDDLNRGLIYAFLQSEAGQFLIKRSKSGSVVESIYEADVSGLPLPLLPKALRREMTRLVDEACELRAKANEKLTEAECAVLRRAMLEPLFAKPGRQDLQDRTGPTVETFATPARCVTDYKKYFGCLRLDASAYHPQAMKARARIGDRDHDTLSALVQEILYIGKVYRVFIEDSSVGVPLVSGKDLVKSRPPGDKLLAKLDALHIERCTVKRGWMLVSRSGNVGRVAMCHRNFEGCVASEHILRIIPDPTKLNPYYLAAFLNTEYGQAQIDALTYGSVIITMSKDQLGSILVPVPPDKGDSIGEEVRDAYDMRADACQQENAAITLLTMAIDRGRDYIESEWGSEY